MLEQVPVRLGRDDPQVEAQAVVRDHGRLRVAVCDDVDHPWQLREVRRQLGGLGGRRDDVEVAEALLAATHRAGLRDVHRSRMVAQHGHHRLHGRQAHTEQPPALVGILRLECEGLQDLLFALRAEPRQRAQPFALGSLLQLVERRHAELLPDARGRLGAEPGQAHEQDDLRRDRGLPLRQRLDLALVDDLHDLLLDRLADSLELLRAPVEGKLRDRS